MSFATRSAQQSLGLVAYVTIDGLPFVFSTLLRPPSAWAHGAPTVVEIGGEHYTWVGNLLLGDKLEGVECRAEPWAGMGETGSLDLTFVRDSTWDELLNYSLHRGAVSLVTAPVDSTDVTILVDSAAAFNAGGGTAYLGPETVTYTGKGATSLTGVTRGCWGSYARCIRVGESPEEQGAGPYIADHSLLTVGRVAHLWLGTGKFVDGEFVPYGTAPCSTEDREAYAGSVTAQRPDTMCQTVTLSLAQFTSAVRQDVYSRWPHGKLGIDPVFGLVHIHAENWYIPHAWIWGDAETDPNHNDRWNRNARLQRDAGGGTPEDVPAGLYTLAELGDYLTFSLNNAPYPLPLTGTTTVAIAVGDSGDGLAYTVVVGSDDTAAGGDEVYTFALLVESDLCLWRHLGWTETPQAQGALGANGTAWTLECDNPAPLFVLGATDLVRRIPFSYLGDLDFNGSPGWNDGDGNAIPGYARVGEEIVEFTGVVLNSVGDKDFFFLEVSARAQFGSETRTAFVVEQDDAVAEVVQVLGFPNTPWPLVALALLQSCSEDASNGSYDAGWYGCGIYWPEALVDVDSFETCARELDARVHICITETQSLEKVLSACLVLDQCFLAQGHTGTAQALRCFRTKLPMESEQPNALALTHANLVTGAGFGYDVDEGRVINALKGENAGYDAGAEFSSERLHWRHQTSSATWGRNEPLALDLKDQGDAGSARAALLNYAQILTARWGVPFAIVEVALACRADMWLLELGDLCALTHDLIPAQVDPGRGVTDLLGIVYAIKPVFRDFGPGATRGKVTLLVANPGGGRLSTLAPSAYGTALNLGLDEITCNDHTFSFQDDQIDALYFPAGTKVRLYTQGDEAAAETRTVDSIIPGGADATKIKLTAATGLTPPLIVELADYDTAGATDAQKRYSHLSDGDALVESDPAFFYS